MNVWLLVSVQELAGHGVEAELGMFHGVDEAGVRVDDEAVLCLVLRWLVGPPPRTA